MFRVKRRSFDIFPYGQQGVLILSKKTGKDTKTDGTASGRIVKGRPQLRTGMAIDTRPCGASAVISGFLDRNKKQAQKILLGGEKVSPKTQTTMPGLGISGR